MQNKNKTINIITGIFVFHLIALLLLVLVQGWWAMILISNSAVGVLAAYGLARRGFERWAAWGILAVAMADIHLSIIRNGVSPEISGRAAPVNMLLMALCLLVSLFVGGQLINRRQLFAIELMTGLTFLLLHTSSVYLLNGPLYLLWGSIVYLGSPIVMWGRTQYLEWRPSPAQPSIIGHISRFRYKDDNLIITVSLEDGPVKCRIREKGVKVAFNDFIVIEQYEMVETSVEGVLIEVKKFTISK